MNIIVICLLIWLAIGFISGIASSIHAYKILSRDYPELRSLIITLIIFSSTVAGVYGIVWYFQLKKTS
jgi:hypothetical protein